MRLSRSAVVKAIVNELEGKLAAETDARVAQDLSIMLKTTGDMLKGQSGSMGALGAAVFRRLTDRVRGPGDVVLLRVYAPARVAEGSGDAVMNDVIGAEMSR